MRFTRCRLLEQQISALTFGTGSVLGRVGRRDSLRSLGAAFDQGINIFDTARSYGYGDAEGLLGEFFRHRRSKVVIASKFGILPNPQPLWKRAIKPMARTALQLLPGLAKGIRGQVSSQFQPGQFTVETLDISVETSLKSLRTDYLDILFIHDATLASIGHDELLSAMEQLKNAGKVRVLGVSSDAAIAEAAAKRPLLQAIQFPSNASNSFANPKIEDSGSPLLRMANQPFAGGEGLPELACRLAASDTSQPFSESLREKLLDGDRSAVIADLVLNLSLAGNDTVVTSMMSPEHLRTNLAAVSNSRFDSGELAQLRAWLTSGLQTRPMERAFGV